MRVMTFAGTRPEIIKLSRVIPALDKHTEHAWVHTGQNDQPELRDVHLRDLQLREPDIQCSVRAPSPAETVANVLTESNKILRKYKPDAVLILGDTNSALAAYSAKRLQIPIFHMEAGNRCFDDRTPEEINRRIVDHIADINLPYTEHARQNLLREGLHPSRIIKTGSPMREVLEHYGAGYPKPEWVPEPYYLVSLHREENVDAKAGNVITLVNDLARAEPKTQVVLSLHPRTAYWLGSVGWFGAPNISICKPFGFLEYCALQKHAKCVISDSGTLAEESALLDFPAVLIRASHERPEADEAGSLVRSDMASYRVQAAIKLAQQPRDWIPDAYEGTNVADIVVRTIVGYTDYIRRNVWRQ